MYWVESTAIFDQRRKKDKRSPSQIYNILSDEIGLSPASFYRHQRHPRKASMDKIISWIENEEKRVVSFANSSNSIINDTKCEVSNS
jgi:hypothetical protein